MNTHVSWNGGRAGSEKVGGPVGLPSQELCVQCKVRYTHKTVPQLVAAVGILVTEELAQVSRPQRTQRKFDLVESSQTPETGVEANRKTPAQVRWCCVQSKPGAHPRGLRVEETRKNVERKR